MDDEDVSLICVMSSFIVPHAPNIFFFYLSRVFGKDFQLECRGLSGCDIAKIRSKSRNLNTLKHIRHYSDVKSSAHPNEQPC